MDKCTAISLHSGILYSSQDECSTATLISMDGCQQHSMELKCSKDFFIQLKILIIVKKLIK